MRALDIKDPYSYLTKRKAVAVRCGFRGLGKDEKKKKVKIVLLNYFEGQKNKKLEEVQKGTRLKCPCQLLNYIFFNQSKGKKKFWE